jgi:hypothetical protein
MGKCKNPFIQLLYNSQEKKSMIVLNEDDQQCRERLAIKETVRQEGIRAWRTTKKSDCVVSTAEKK